MKGWFLLVMSVFSLALLEASVTIIQQTDSSILFEYRLDAYNLTEENGMLRIDASGMDYSTVSGSPLIPHAEVKIGIPPSGDISVTILDSSVERKVLNKRLMPVPEVIMLDGISANRYTINESLYYKQSTTLLKTLPHGTYRGYGFVPLHIHPFSYDGSYNLNITTRALIRVDILGNTALRSLAEPDELSDLMLSAMLNPKQVRNWRSAAKETINYADFSRSDHWIRLETDRDGMFKLGYNQLSSFPLSVVDPASFRLFTTGGQLLPYTVNNPGPEFREIPIRVIGAEDGSFDPQDYIVFYGTNRNGVKKNQTLQENATYYNPYSGNTIYWLTFGNGFSGTPMRMQELPIYNTWVKQSDSHSEQFRLETENYRREQTGFDWYMTRLFGNTTAEYEFQVNLQDVDRSSQQNLSFWIQQEDIKSTLWHNISVYVNGEPIPADTLGGITFRWRGVGEYIFYKPTSAFQNGTNTIRIKVIRDGIDNLYLNWITVDYKRLLNKSTGQYVVNQLAFNYGENVRYNFTGNSNTWIYRVNSFGETDIVPLRTAENGFYFVAQGMSQTTYILSSDSELYTPLNITAVNPENIATPSGAVDNLIIIPDEYLGQAQSLASMHLNLLGKKSLVVKQSDIFTQFNGGHPDPVAIRQFIRHVYHNFPTPRLTSVTLLGLGTVDWRNFSSQAAEKNKIMVFQRGTGKGAIVADDYFAMLTQASYPEVAIGRYPVRNLNELNNMLGNFQRYIQEPQGGWWRNSMVFLADDLYNGDATHENIHTQQVESARNRVHPSILVDKIFAWLYEFDEFQNKPQARDDMIAAVNEGRLLWYYIGHGAYDTLGAEDYFNGATDMGRFTNQGKLPFFMAASCQVSHFDYWGYESLGQKLVLQDNVGAIASYSATRMSSSIGNGPMMENLLYNLANNRNPLGYSIALAKFQHTGSDDNDATYVLLGDPLLKVVPPIRDSLITVVGLNQDSQSDTLFARQRVQIDGHFRPSLHSGLAAIQAFSSVVTDSLDFQTIISKRGNNLFKGEVSVQSGNYSASFIVPDDVRTGNTGLIVSYLWDEEAKQDYVNFKYPTMLSSQAVIANNTDAPQIEIFLGSMDFRPGDTVTPNTTLIARISDENGINITGNPGHNMLMVLDGSAQPVSVTSYFSYELDSHTQGTLRYPLNGLQEGHHTIQLIAFDNFNSPAVKSTEFYVKKSGDLTIDRLLPYPNPMSKETWFTFMLSDNCDLTLDIYTITGKKVHTIKTTGLTGFNKIHWDGRDNKGGRLANNTYFIKLKATSGNRKAEKTERLVIYN